MSLAHADLPADPEALRAFALACQAELKVAEASVQLRTLEIEKLRLQIAKLRRMQFGRSSERVSRQIEQLELQLEELETDEAVRVEKVGGQPADRQPSRPKRQPLPDHLSREEIVHEPGGDEACVCPDCGGGMARLGEDVTEVLDYVPGRFQVIRHVRPKYACKACDTITQAPAPALPTPRSRATPAMLAHLPIDARIGRKIAERREQLAIGIADLAGRLRISVRRAQDFESGRTSIRASELVVIGAALGCSPVSCRSWPRAMWSRLKPRSPPRSGVRLLYPVGAAGSIEACFGNREFPDIRAPRQGLARTIMC
jgi:hypothetical protein